MSDRATTINQWRKPTGWLGRIVLWRMNASHSKLTDWCLAQVSLQPHYAILDVGCGGGRTVGKLAAIASQGKVYGVDYSAESVAASIRDNLRWIESGRVEIREGPVSQLPFPGEAFDFVSAIETHFWWPDLPGGMLEIRRVLKPGGTLLLGAEVYKGAPTLAARLAERHAHVTGLNLLSAGEHRELFATAGYEGIRVVELAEKGWICAVASKPSLPVNSAPDDR